MLYDDLFEDSNICSVKQDYIDINNNSDRVLFDLYNLKISFVGVCRCKIEYDIEEIAIKILVQNNRQSEIFLCHSIFNYQCPGYQNGWASVSPHQEKTLLISLESIDFLDDKPHKVSCQLILEDGRRRILGVCRVLEVAYNIFSGKYQYQFIGAFKGGKRRELRELDFRVLKQKDRGFYYEDGRYIYYLDLIPITFSNNTNMKRALRIINCEFDYIQATEFIGIDGLNDTFYLSPWCSETIYIGTFMSIGSTNSFILDFMDEYNNIYYANTYTYSNASMMFVIQYSFVFFHEGTSGKM